MLKFGFVRNLDKLLEVADAKKSPNDLTCTVYDYTEKHSDVVLGNVVSRLW